MKVLISTINKALDRLYQDDADLLERRVHERSIVFRFGLYFFELLKRNDQYTELYLDFDYNRNMKNPKRTINFPEGVYPDLILHKRKSNDHNILALEFKTYWNVNNDLDIRKLKDLTNQRGQYGFKLGVSILLGKTLKACKFIYVRNGRITKEL